MGIAASDVRSAAKEANKENEKTAVDALNTMGAVAREKMKNFRLKVESNSETHEIPVDKVIYQDQLMYCTVSEKDDKLKDTVKNLVSNIAKGKWADALTTGSDAILDALFGSMVGSEGEHSLYRIIVGPLGGIRRVDINLYMWAFSSETMIKVAKNILVVSIIVSSVDLLALDVATLRVAIEETCGDDIKMGRQLLDEVLTEWKSEQELHVAIAGVHPKRDVDLPVAPVSNRTSDGSTPSMDTDDQPYKKRKVEDNSKNKSTERDPKGPGSQRK